MTSENLEGTSTPSSTLTSSLATPEQVEQKTIDLLVEAKKDNGPGFAYMMIDLADFNPVLYGYGIEAAEEFLLKVGKRIKTILRDDDLIAHLSGTDQFAVVFPHLRVVVCYSFRGHY